MMNLNKKNMDALQNRYALRAVSYLASSTTDLPHDVTERLRAARFQATAARKIAKSYTTAPASAQGQGTSLTWSGEDYSYKSSRIAVLISLAVLIIGLLLINIVQSENRAQELAEVDVAILTDALPPAAFSDPGFIQFLKNIH